MLTPLLAPKYVLPQLRNRMVDRSAHSGASRRDLPFVICAPSRQFGQLLLSDCAGTFALHLPGHERAIVRQNLGIYDKRPVILNRRLKQLCFWSSQLRN
jgi:hypothetical protein